VQALAYLLAASTTECSAAFNKCSIKFNCRPTAINKAGAATAASRPHSFALTFTTADAAHGAARRTQSKQNMHRRAIMVLGELLIFYRDANCNLQRNYAAAPNCAVHFAARSFNRLLKCSARAALQPGCMNALKKKSLGKEVCHSWLLCNCFTV